MPKEEIRTEWQRLNPVYTGPQDGFLKAIWNAGRETLPGYFAPARLGWWLIKRGLRSIGHLFGKGEHHE